MLNITCIIDTSGSMGERAKLAIVRDVIKTFNLYHLIDDIHFSLDIYSWNDKINPCQLNEVADLICQGKPDFHQLLNFLNNDSNQYIFIATDGIFSKTQLEILQKNKEILKNVYLIIVGQEENNSLKKSELFIQRIFSSDNLYDLIQTLDISESTLSDDWE